jgi:hypothetical protein
MTEKIKTKFNPDDHMDNIKGKPYLPVAWRIVWMRTEQPLWSIETEITDYREDKQAMAKATIRDETGRIIATGHKTAKPRGMIADYVELAETGAIGRALAYCGFGTQFSPELNEDDGQVVDSPINTKDVVQGNVEPQKYILTPVGQKHSMTYFAIAKDAGVSGEEAKNAVKKMYRLESYTEVSKVQLDNMINAMKKRKEKMQEVDTGELDSIVDEFVKKEEASE